MHKLNFLLNSSKNTVSFPCLQPLFTSVVRSKKKTYGKETVVTLKYKKKIKGKINFC